MGAPQQAAPFLGLGPNDRSAILASVTVAILLLTVSVIAGKLFYRRDKRVWRNYDFILLAGVLFLLVQSGLVVHTASLGIGKHADALDEASLGSLAKVSRCPDVIYSPRSSTFNVGN